MNPSHLSNQELEKVADAIETLRLAALGRGIFFERIQDAINVLDNADLFAEIDEEHFARVADYALRNEER